MINFFKQIFDKIARLDIYTNKYLEAAGHNELPALAYASWGAHLADVKDFNNAVETLKTAMLMYGSNPKPCINLGIIYAKLKEYDKAANVLNEALKRDSNNAYAYSLLGAVYTACDKFDKAGEMLKKAAKLAPADPEVYLNYGIFYAKKHDRQKAAEMFKKAKIYNSADVHAAFLLGVMYFESGKIQDALSEFSFTEKYAPGYKKLAYYMALCFQKEQDYVQASKYVCKALKEESDSPAVYILAANIYFNLDNKEMVKKIYNLGIECGVNDFDFFMSAGIAYEAFGDNEKAKEYAQKALMLDSSNSDALYRAGLYMKKDGDNLKALEYFNKAIEIDESNVHALSGAGMIKYEQGRFDEALEMFLKAALSGSKNLYGMAANCCFKLGRLKKSLEYSEKMLEYYPDNIETLVNYAMFLISAGRFQDALRKIRRACRLEPKSDKAAFLLALSELKCGIYSSAVQTASKILEKNPDNKGAVFIKAQALINLNKPENALDALNSLDSGTQNTEIYSCLAYKCYKLLASKNASDYNIGMLVNYEQKIQNIDAENAANAGIMQYFNEQKQ